MGQDTTLSQIIQMVSDAAATKAPIAKIADKVSGVFVPAVISIALVTTIVWLLIRKPFGYSLARGISVLVISCPCALGLATPVAIMVGSGLGAKNGILFKTAASLEETGRIRSSPLTKPAPLPPASPQSRTFSRQRASRSRSSSASPFHSSKERAPAFQGNFKAGRGTRHFSRRGFGISSPAWKRPYGELSGQPLCGGNDKFIGAKAQIPEAIQKQAQSLSDEGKTRSISAWAASFSA